MSGSDTKLESLQRQAKRALDDRVNRAIGEVLELFSRPDEAKVTLIIRCPWLDDGDAVFTNDARTGIESALDRHMPTQTDVESISSDNGAAS